MVRKEFQNPRGGLNRKGRVFFGVKKPVTKARTLEELRRKGSFLNRFYDRKKIPPLKKPTGEPTRYALAAQAWGESVPESISDVRKLARKGDQLLKQYNNERRK